MGLSKSAPFMSDTWVTSRFSTFSSVHWSDVGGFHHKLFKNRIYIYIYIYIFFFKTYLWSLKMNKSGSGSFIHGIQYPLINFNAANTL